MHVVVVAAVIDPARGLLLVRKRDDGVWYCPQGWLRPGEDLRDTAKRKVSEETGVLVSVEKVLAMRSRMLHDSPPEGELMVLVRCHALAGTPRPGICELDAAYTPMEALPEMAPHQAEWILEALAGNGRLLE